MPFFFIHDHPEQALEKVKAFVPICSIPQDCLLFFNTWINGVAGFVHTQIGSYHLNVAVIYVTVIVLV